MLRRAKEEKTNRKLQINLILVSVVIWEIITEEEPWKDMNAVEAAISVITAGKRLPMPSCEIWLQKMMNGECNFDVSSWHFYLSSEKIGS